ncbi:MAG: lipid A biosynthesis lauroyl acyltransferase [Pseudolabrys sp.]|nr:lipid A biosynthesis lauroyl acyltransferase [Pseudolabrys sp.]
MPQSRWRTRLLKIGDATAGVLMAGFLRLLRLPHYKRMASTLSWVLRKIGPKLREHRIAKAQLMAAFPEKSEAEIERILEGVWDNIGRYTAEFAQIDRIITPDWGEPPADVGYTKETYDRFQGLRRDGKPALIFAAHLANWELSAQVAKQYGLDTIVLYRRPNIGAVADAVTNIRAGSMGELMATGLDAPVKLGRELEAGRHVAMLVDQYYTRGVDVTFFGRRTKANPLLARLARQVEAPIHGVRIIRLPDEKFTVELTPEVAPIRDAEGKIDVAGTTQAVMSVVEGWVREHPEQWLWLHRRWRD